MDRVLLEIIGAIVAYGTVKGTCEMIGQAGKKAYPTLDNREFDIQNRRNGLKMSQTQISTRLLHAVGSDRTNMAYCLKKDTKHA